jgi:hypothetical protein
LTTTYKMYRTLLYDTLPPYLFASVSPLTSRFPLTMAAGGFGPYHRLWTNDAPSKRKVVTPTSGGMMPVLGFVSYHWGRELLVTPPPTTHLSVRLFWEENSFII